MSPARVRPATGLYAPRSRAEVIETLVTRAHRRLDALDDDTLQHLLEDTLYRERQRLESQAPVLDELDQLEALAEALVRRGRGARVTAGLALVRRWSNEIHGRFSLPAYRFASRVFPPALGALLAAAPARLGTWDVRPDQRVRVEGPLPLIRQLADEATLVLAPTHVSNLDSPIIGLALTLAGLPPFQYGAGLNLFGNPVLGWWMSRLGAYTVDRTKQAELYKDVLKDYSVLQLTRRHHSLFFPGGTRSRSGLLERRVKKGLLGTGVLAWQEMLAAGREDPEIYVVPMTLSYTLCLEARTLIEDFLADQGKQRYIITDDEFSQSRRVAAFAQRVLSLDASVVCRFGAPLDVLGRPVPEDATARAEAAQARRGYVCASDGTVQPDAQRDHVYTDMLARKLVEVWPRDATVLPTHLVAWAAWRSLEEAVDSTDPFRLVRAPVDLRRLGRGHFLSRLRRAQDAVRAGARQGRWHAELPSSAEGTLDTALDHFARYHTSRAVGADAAGLFVEDAKLCLYYRNRLAHADLEAS
ncbi:MAG: 1-acyl-sn-glycerol-3-phosphate acyltransferase [Alphaproteobacteria bacterium]|nr:1-acyl-sn-glycerol-3-phosphate acyltransferase [Alphaproteobacteria bacterium]